LGAECGDEGGALACDAGAASEDVEGDALAQQDLADGTADGGAVGYGSYLLTFFDVPFNSGISVGVSVNGSKDAESRGGIRATELREDFIEEGNARNNSLFTVNTLSGSMPR
jgi:hypothetical protein